MAQKLLLIDASNSIYRAFFALPALANSAGVPTHATLGFTTMLQKLLRESAPDAVVVVWDAPSRTSRRKELYSDYKATRDATPEDLRAQIPWIRKIVAAYRFATVEQPGEEADDVIAALARSGERAGYTVEIMSTDRDLLQLVSDKIVVVDTMRDRRLGPAEVEARYGVPPAQMLDLRSLVGDSSDNIPGVKGIGEKGAAELLRTHGTLDALLANPDVIAGKRAREALRAGADMARLSRELSRLRDDLPIEFDPVAMAMPEPDRDALAAIFRELELKRLLEQLGDTTPVRVAVEAAPVAIAIAATPADAAALAARLADAPVLSLELALEPKLPLRGELLAIALGTAADAAAVVLVRGAPGDDVLAALRAALRARRAHLDRQRPEGGAARAGPARDLARRAALRLDRRRVRRRSVAARRPARDPRAHLPRPRLHARRRALRQGREAPRARRGPRRGARPALRRARGARAGAAAPRSRRRSSAPSSSRSTASSRCRWSACSRAWSRPACASTRRSSRRSAAASSRSSTPRPNASTRSRARSSTSARPSSCR